MAQRSMKRVIDPAVLNEIRIYHRALRRARIPVKALLLFGSRAKGTNRADSDIDIAIISPSFGRDYHRELVQLLGLRTSQTLDIEPHPMHPDDLNDRWSTFAHEVKTYGISIMDTKKPAG